MVQDHYELSRGSYPQYSKRETGPLQPGGELSLQLQSAFLLNCLISRARLSHNICLSSESNTAQRQWQQRRQQGSFESAAKAQIFSLVSGPECTPHLRGNTRHLKFGSSSNQKLCTFQVHAAPPYAALLRTSSDALTSVLKQS
jgi:hypothetical protein